MQENKTCPVCSVEVPTKFEKCWNCNYDFISKSQASIIGNYNEDKQIQNCTLCHSSMKLAGNINVHEGTNWGILGDIGHLFTNHLKLRMYICEKCKKIDFFAE